MGEKYIFLRIPMNLLFKERVRKVTKLGKNWGVLQASKFTRDYSV
jgi:hypothetical protein